MQILVTGAYGNVGGSAVEELVRCGHTVTCYDLPTRANRRTARRWQRRYGRQVRAVWGDLRRREDVALAVEGQDVVVHLAFIIPHLSATGVDSEKRPDWARAVNVGGTRNVLMAMAAQPRPPRLIFASSYHVYGRTQHMPPPRTLDEPPEPVEHYAQHKVECEEMVRESELTWTILRFAAVLPLSLQANTGMFDVPLDNRMEYVHVHDVALAIARAVGSSEVWGRTLLIGGGSRCQYRFGEIAELLLETMGVGMLPAEAFGRTPFATDWIDTGESQRLLDYQRYDLHDYARELAQRLGWRRHLVRAVRPLVRLWLLRRSPHYRQALRESWQRALHLAFGWWS